MTGWVLLLLRSLLTSPHDRVVQAGLATQTNETMNGFVEWEYDAGHGGDLDYCGVMVGCPRPTTMRSSPAANPCLPFPSPIPFSLSPFPPPHPIFSKQSMFTPDRLPVMAKLAEEFAVMDRFFCSHPGPTWPNRLFCLSATSMGCTETGTYYKNIPNNAYPQKTIFDSLAGATLLGGGGDRGAGRCGCIHTMM